MARGVRFFPFYEVTLPYRFTPLSARVRLQVRQIFFGRSARPILLSQPFKTRSIRSTLRVTSAVGSL